MKVGDLVIERRLHAQPFHWQLSIVIGLLEERQRKVMVKSLKTGSEYWLYRRDVEVIDESR
jgi:hypothetical protein